VKYLRDHEDELDFDVREVLGRVHRSHIEEEQLACGCPGSEARSFTPQSAVGQPVAVSPVSMAPVNSGAGEQASELKQWPVQMHLINPTASYFRQSDMVLAADCVGFSLGNFHSKWLKGKSLAIACPKLDDGHESYISKIKSLVDDAKINTFTVMMMQVPCCGGLIAMVNTALSQATRKVPVKIVIVSAEGEIMKEEWT